MLNLLITIAIIALGLNMLRFLFGAGYIIVKGEANGKKVGRWFQLLNLLEATAIVAAYVILIVTYYSK